MTSKAYCNETAIEQMHVGIAVELADYLFTFLIKVLV